MIDVGRSPCTPGGSLRPIQAVRDKFTSQSLVRSRGKRDRRPGKHSLPRGENPIRNNGADVAELVDARDLKSLDGNVVWVRVPPPAPKLTRPMGIAAHCGFVIRAHASLRRGGSISWALADRHPQRLASLTVAPALDQDNEITATSRTALSAYCWRRSTPMALR